jgi:hypothetical protein
MLGINDYVLPKNPDDKVKGIKKVPANTGTFKDKVSS